MKLKKVSRQEFYGYLMISVFIVFTILKTRGVIDWSWWWVTSPLWLPFVVSIFSIVVIYIVLTIFNGKVEKLSKEIEEDLKEFTDLLDKK